MTKAIRCEKQSRHRRRDAKRGFDARRHVICLWHVARPKGADDRGKWQKDREPLHTEAVFHVIHGAASWPLSSCLRYLWLIETSTNLVVMPKMPLPTSKIGPIPQENRKGDATHVPVPTVPESAVDRA